RSRRSRACHLVSVGWVGRPLDAPAWCYRSDGVQPQVGLGLDTGLDWGWTPVWTGVGTQKGPPREGGPAVFRCVWGWRGGRQGLDPVEVVGLQGDVSQLRQVVAPDRLQAGFLGELLDGDAAGRVVGGAVCQRLQLAQVPPVDGGDLALGGVQGTGDRRAVRSHQWTGATPRSEGSRVPATVASNNSQTCPGDPSRRQRPGWEPPPGRRFSSVTSRPISSLTSPRAASW